MKNCPLCNAEKPIDAFAVDRSKKDGRKSRCKECDAAKKKAAYYAASPKARSNKVTQQRYRRWRDIAEAHGERWLIEQVQTLKRKGRLAEEASTKAEQDDRLAAFFREARRTSEEVLRTRLGSRLWDRVAKPFATKKQRAEAREIGRERLWANLQAISDADVIGMEWDEQTGRKTPVYDLDDGPTLADFAEKDASDRVLREGQFARRQSTD